MSFDIYVQELKNPWESLTENPASEVLRFFEKNPFGNFTRLYVDGLYNYSPFDHEKTLSELTKPLGTEGMVGVRLGSGGVPFPVEGTINNTAFNTIISIGINSDDLKKIADLTEITKYLQEWRFVLPAFFSGGASADDRDNDFWIDVAHTEPLPDCIGSRLGWYHVISPLGYKNSFKREDLLNAPALKVEELNDGTIIIQAYQDPLDFASEDTTRKIVEITSYLNDKRKD